MDSRGLSKREQRELEAIERQLDHDAPEVVSAFRSCEMPSGPPSRRTWYLVLAVLLALVGLVANLPLFVISGMGLVLSAPLLPDPLPRSAEAPSATPPGRTGSGPVPFV